jgi:Methyltransferase TRM13
MSGAFATSPDLEVWHSCHIWLPLPTEAQQRKHNVVAEGLPAFILMCSTAQPAVVSLQEQGERRVSCCCLAGWALCGHDAQVGTVSDSQPDPEAPAPDAILRHARIAAGVLCKRLIDHGRLEWLQGHGMHVEYVRYVDGQVSGENRMLLARPV